MNPLNEMKQVAIDFFAHPAFPVHARARATDPGTSIDAAINAEKFAKSHAGRILTALNAFGPASAHQLQYNTGLTVVQIDRRTSECQRMGLIELTGDVVDGFRVWRVVSAKH